MSDIALKYDLQKVLDEVKIKMNEVYGDDLDKIILYGSYARGDYKDESDIDIMVLVKCGEEDIKKLRKRYISAGSALCLEYDVEISTLVYNLDYFDCWKKSMPLFKNIVKEGIRV